MTLDFRLAHRVMGLCLALPLLLLVVTGLPLQFTVALHLGSVGVPYSWVHAVYGIEAPVTAQRSANVAQLGDLLFLSGASSESWERVDEPLLGAQKFDQVLVVVTTNELLLAVPEPGVPIERTKLPHRAKRFGTTADLHFVLDSESGLLRSEDYGVSWVRIDSIADGSEVTWLDSTSAPAGAQLKQRYGAVLVTWERWLQDLHTGRFFGPVGVWIMNIASFVFILLGFTGLVLWYTSRRKSLRRVP